jgi:competence protein ComEA
MALLSWFWWQAANVTATVSPISAMDSTESSEATVPEPESGSAADADSPSGGSGDSPPGTIIVHVAGAVLRAGIVELPEGSRLHEAIAAAGGSATDADPDQLNLAAVLEDGQKVLVPRQGETVPAGGPAGGGAAVGDTSARGSPTDGEGPPPVAGKINLNTAGPDELAALPRVGPVLAQRIVDWRVQHGKFQRVEELDAVDGIGPKLLAVLLPLVRV